MIKVYSNGNDFYEDNKAFLLSNKYTEALFRMDAPLLTFCDQNEYAIMVEESSKRLVVLCKDPYNILFYGDPFLAPTLIDYLAANHYRLKDFFCPSELGPVLVNLLSSYGFDYEKTIGMDFMEARVKTIPSSSLVEHAKAEDLDELVKLARIFNLESGSRDEINVERFRLKLPAMRIIRKDGLIIAMARIGESSEEDRKIGYVFTRKEYRCQGYARLLVGTIVNEIIDSGYYATLNVDQANPISNHVYASLGFKKVFSQELYYPKR